MKLLYKDLALAVHPTFYIFTQLGCLVLAPAYPYTVVFLFGCLAPYISFMYARETNDAWFTALLPVKKSEIIASKFRLVCCAQLTQLCIALVFALLRFLLHIPNNPVGLDPTVAWFGIGFFIYGVYNLVFFPAFYKTGYKAGKAFFLAMIPVVGCMLITELLAHLPALLWMDSLVPGHLLSQIPLLLAGLVFYGCATVFSCRLSVLRYEKVDL